MSVFDHLPMSPPLARYALESAFAADPRPHKRLLHTGLYVDDDGTTSLSPTLAAVEAALAQDPSPPDYLPLAGDPAFRDALSTTVAGRPLPTWQTPGATAALGLLASALQALRPDTRWHLPDPGWPNHAATLAARGIPTHPHVYPVGRDGLDVARWLDGLAATLRPGDAVLLQVGAHNPCGWTPDADGWAAAADLLARCDALPVLDVAFLGFHRSPDEELAPARALAARVGRAAWTVSLGKALRYYRERVAGIVLDGLPALHAGLAAPARAAWSSPPAWGGRVATAVLTEHRAAWLAELGAVRVRLAGLRETLHATWVTRPEGAAWTRPPGLFLRLPVDAAVIERLAVDHALYAAPSGLVNLSALSPSVQARLADTIAAPGDVPLSLRAEIV